MTDEEFQSLIHRIESGAVLVGVDRHVARRFFTDSDISLIKEATGEAPYLQKYVVRASSVLAFWALLGSFVFAVLGFSWWSALVIPASFAVWSLGASPSTGMRGVTLLLALSVLGLWFDWFPSQNTAWFAILIAVALWSIRFCYVAAGRFMIQLAMRNKRAFEYLAPHIRMQEV